MDESRQWEFIRNVANGNISKPFIYEDIRGKRSRIRSWILDKLDGQSKVFPEQEQMLLIAAHKLNLFPSSLELFYLMKNKQEVREKSYSGTNCPVCDRNVRVYKRAFNSNMATFMQSLMINSLRDKIGGGDGFIHHSDCLYTGRDYTCVQYWDLAETYSDSEGNKKMSGNWRPTERAELFIRGEILIPKYVFTLNGEVLKKSDEKISFQEALGVPFDYKQLMEAFNCTHVDENQIPLISFNGNDTSIEI